MQELRQPRILIVEGEAIAVIDLCKRLQSVGCFPISTNLCSKDTLTIIEKEKPDLVLMDIKIQGEFDGIELAKSIKNKFKIPVIFITSSAGSSILEQEKENLSYGYITEPFTDKELKTAIELALFRHRAEKEINRLNRLYLFISQVNQAIVRCNIREELLSTICKIAVNLGGYDLTWIGFTDETTKQVIPVASYGKTKGYLDKLIIYADDRPEGRGLTGIAIRTRKPYISFDYLADPSLKLWWSLGSSMGFKSAAAFPLFIKDDVVGAIMLYSSDKDRFNETEIKLLEEVSADISHALNSFVEVEKRRRSEKQISDLNALYISLVESIEQALFRKDKEGKFIFGNTRFCKILGMPIQDIIGKTDFDFYPKNLAKKYRDDDIKIMETATSLDTIEEHQTPDGKRMFVRVLKSPVLDGVGNIIGVQGIFWDVTKEKEAEELLKIQSIALKSAASGIMIINSERIITWVNPAMEKMSGYTKEELIGKNASILKSDANESEYYFALWEAINSGKVWQGKTVSKRKNGETYPVELTFTPIVSDNGKIEHYVCIQQDISAKNELDFQIHRMQRLTGVATLAGGIAHNINNSLTPIIMSAELLKDEFTDPESRELLNTITKCAERSADLIRQVLAVTRGVEVKKEILSPAIIVKEVHGVINQTFPKEITIETSIEENIWQIEGDRGYLNQMLLNLCLNSRDAMPQGGILKILARNYVADESFTQRFINAKPGNYVLFEVIDTGCGISQEIIERIFDPFFTTKDIGKGAGMGLPAVQSIVKSHNGFIVVRSAVGVDSTFQIFIPAIDNLKPSRK